MLTRTGHWVHEYSLLCYVGLQAAQLSALNLLLCQRVFAGRLYLTKGSWVLLRERDQLLPFFWEFLVPFHFLGLGD